jgi:sugar lactone lactonase YvrE
VDKTGAKPLQNLVAGLMLVGMASCLWFMVHAGNQINRELGPNALAVSADGKLFVASHGRLHVFSDEKQREASYDFEPMGLPRAPADIGVRSDGKLYFANMEEGRLAVCDLQKAACDGKDLGLAGWTPAHLQPVNTFKFFIDEPRSRLYISDNGAHSLVIADATGKVLSRTVASREVIFPNQVASYAPGELTVADTNHNRIVTFDVSADKVGKVLREFSTRGLGPSRPGRIWPFGMARLPDGRYWVLIARDGMKDADVMLFDAKGTAVRRVDLGAESDPFAIALWKDAVVVADGRNARLQAFDIEGGNRRDIRDDAFTGELRAIARRSDEWREHRFMAIAGMVLFPIVGIIVLWRLGVPLVPPNRQPIPRPAGTAKPSALGPGVTWIVPEPEFIRKQSRQMKIAFGAIVGSLVVLLLVLFLGQGTAHLAPRRIATFSVLVVTGLLVIGILSYCAKGAANRLAALALGVSARGLHLRSPAWHGLGAAVERGPFDWRDVYVDGRRLLAGNASLLLKTPSGAELFPRDALEREILSRVPPSHFISSAALGMRAMKAAPAAAKLAYGALVAAMIFYTWVRW